ncbi:MAG: prealbumin-like fold domain-containing protein [Acidimicrobiia bacterium]
MARSRRLVPVVRRHGCRALLVGTIGGLAIPFFGGAGPADALTLTPGEEICWTVSDSTAEATDSDAADALHRIDRLDADPATNEDAVGPTGTRDIEAIALQPWPTPDGAPPVLFAADGGTLGTLNLDGGAFTPVGTGFGEGEGSDGAVRFSDVDGLNFDPTTGVLYGSLRRREADDILFRIDPATGAFVPRHFGGDDYVVVEALSGLSDIDDLAIDQTDGQMFAIANIDGRRDHLVRLDKATGAVADVGVLGEEDMEGISFAPGGQLIGSTGKVHDEEGIWDLDKTSGAASNRRPLDNARDYEALACLLAPVPPPGTLTVVKETRPAGGSEEFSFSTSGNPLPPTFALAGGREVSYTDLPAGTYTITEGASDGWSLSEVACTGASGGSAGSTDTRDAVVALAPGDSVRCVFVNARLEPRVPGAVAPPSPARSQPAQVEPGILVVDELPRTGVETRPWALAAAGMLLASGLCAAVVRSRR